MEKILFSSLVGVVVVVGIVLAIYVAILPTIACHRTRRLNHIHDQLNQIIKLLGGIPDNEEEEYETEDEKK